LRHPCKFQQVSRLGSVTARHLVVGVSQTCGVEQRAPPMFGRATITLGIGPHSSLFCIIVSLAVANSNSQCITFCRKIFVGGLSWETTDRKYFCHCVVHDI